VTILRRALLQGIAFGLAATTVGLWLQMIGFMQRRMGASVPLMLQTSALEILLAVILALVAAPLLRMRGGRVWHLVALALCWIGLERWVSLDSPLFDQMDLAVPVVATLLSLLGLWLARRWPRLPWALGALLWLGALAAPALYLRFTTPEERALGALPPARADAPDVVLVVLDTVRAGNVSAYGYGRPTAPALDALAREGALFLDATSPSTWSLPSHASLFTGRYPSSHGAHGEHRFLDDR